MADQRIVPSPRYTGALDGRFDAQVVTEGPARITKISLGPMDNNVYVVESLPDGDALLVDAANDADELVYFLRQRVPGLSRLVTTHRHPDHWVALEEVVHQLHPRTYAPAGDDAEIPGRTDVLLTDGDVLEVGRLTLEVVTLHGHTPEGLALLLRTPVRTHVFSADSLFPGGPGKTPDAAAFTTLMDELESKLFDRLPDDTVVHPGHGDDTTLGAERPKLPEWRRRGW